MALKRLQKQVVLDQFLGLAKLPTLTPLPIKSSSVSPCIPKTIIIKYVYLRFTDISVSPLRYSIQHTSECITVGLYTNDGLPYSVFSSHTHIELIH